MSNEAAERLRDYWTEAGMIDTFGPDLDRALAHERSAGAAPLDVERLAHAVIRNVNFDEDAGDGYMCRYCSHMIPTHSAGCVYPVAARLAVGSTDR